MRRHVSHLRGERRERRRLRVGLVGPVPARATHNDRRRLESARIVPGRRNRHQRRRMRLVQRLELIGEQKRVEVFCLHLSARGQRLRRPPLQVLKLGARLPASARRRLFILDLDFDQAEAGALEEPRCLDEQHRAVPHSVYELSRVGDHCRLERRALLLLEVIERRRDKVTVAHCLVVFGHPLETPQPCMQWQPGGSLLLSRAPRELLRHPRKKAFSSPLPVLTHEQIHEHTIYRNAVD